MINAWKAAGPNARDIFLMQKLQSVMSSLVETIQNVSVDRVAYLPASSQVVQGVQLVEQVKAACRRRPREGRRPARGAGGGHAGAPRGGVFHRLSGLTGERFERSGGATPEAEGLTIRSSPARSRTNAARTGPIDAPVIWRLD